MASAQCHNDALAITTPVYVVVNSRPTWNASRGPAIIDHQLTAMAKIESEFSKGDDPRSVGVGERLRKAKAYYADLRQRMARS
jgi:hypothetical protein